MQDLLTIIMQVIGSLGFPIVMCILLYKHLDEEQKAHKEEISKLTDAIQDLKLTLSAMRSNNNA